MQLIHYDQTDVHDVHRSYKIMVVIICIPHFPKYWVGTCPMSLDITEKGDPTEHPVFRRLGRPQVHSSNAIQVCSDWLLVDGAGVKPRIS